MKLEIDVTDRAQLVRARNELTHLLEIVEFAIKKHDEKRIVNGGEFLTARATYVHHGPGDRTAIIFPDESGNERPILEIIKALPARFTTSDVLVRMGNEAKEKRNLVKITLKKSVDSGKISIVEKGRGRKPSTYEKAA